MIECNKCVLSRLININFIFTHKLNYKRLESKKKNPIKVFIYSFMGQFNSYNMFILFQTLIY